MMPRFGRGFQGLRSGGSGAIALRNVLYAIGNSGLTRLRSAAMAHVEDPDPVVADAARRAVARLG